MHKQSRRILDCTNNNFQTQQIDSEEGCCAGPHTNQKTGAPCGCESQRLSCLQ